MKAACFSEYGSCDRVAIRQLPTPVPTDDEVLIENRASSINFGNIAHILGRPWPVRAFTGFRRPKLTIPGSDIAGVVTAIGAHVTAFKPGDAVMADRSDTGFGAWAEQVAIRQALVVPKPDSLSFEEAATLPMAACVALHGLHRMAGIQAGQSVLIVGATGGVGPFAVQIAKAAGAEVTAVCAGSKAAFVRQLGADHIIDYHTEDFTRSDRQYDLVAGIAGNRSMLDYRRVLRPHGVYVNIGGGMKQFSSAFTTGPLLNLLGGPKFRFLMHMANRDDLLAVKDMVDAGKLRPTTDRVFPLNQVQAACACYQSGQAAGKIVITIP